LGEEQESHPPTTELWVASLVACVGLSARAFLLRHELPTEGLTVETKFAMTLRSPPRVAWIDVHLVLPARFPESRRGALLRAVEHCAVHSSIGKATEVRIELVPEGRAA
jgi:uncharacterized OsmC-like protein